MTRNVERQNSQAKELLSTLEKIKSAWDALPSEEEINYLVRAASNLAVCLESAGKKWEDLPTEDQIGDLTKAAGNLAASLPDAT